ncbi:MAG TPA: carbohydrate ABC transporter permease [Aggregatilineales bacterium]|jgi:multiple sugar transport system permease protein|nr:carbohydrate ABC transporter permease [Aggregatilineales bacterium]
MSVASRQKRVLQLSLRYLLLLILLTLALFPIYWIAIGSLRDNSAITSLPPQILPTGDLRFDNYERVITRTNFLTYYWNSIVVSGTTIILSIVISVLAAYSFSRYRFIGRGLAMNGILSAQMFPLVAILISLFSFFSSLNLVNNLFGLVLAHLTVALPFSIWFLKAFFDSIPRELEEAAYIDGAGRMRTLLQVILPLVRPGILAVTIYTFLMSWDDFLFALILITRDELRTLPVGIAVSFLGEFEYDWSGMMTVSVISSLPILLVFVFLNRYMVDGLTRGAVKG